ncbi:kelch-like protein 2 [Metopolophium dirhodum]|uniref:kelch-like protein 2 n=1 Tax=Metopolophium dirhodum TaxID=44670 RepID=UPI00298F46AD|nr:kelch-like protein 2 [Metopolophium dirhodum]
MSLEEIVKLITSEEIVVLSEAKVFECVILWVKHDLESRNHFLPQLMEHVRLPLIPNKYIFKNVVGESLINNCLKCKDYVNEALHFHSLKSDDFVTIPNNIRTKPRQRGDSHKGILVVGGMWKSEAMSSGTEWYDPTFNQWQSVPQLNTPRLSGGLAVIKNNFVFYMGGYNSEGTYKSLEILDLSSTCPGWKTSVDMLVTRRHLGVGTINNYIYAVGGCDGYSCLNSAEVFDCTTQEWRMVSSMSTRRNFVGVGVLNNLLYAVGGCDSKDTLNSVECYNPCLDKWTPVAEMRERRCSMGVGVIDDVLYAVGGHNGLISLRSVEAYRPSTGVWTTIPQMHYRRCHAGVAVLEGVLFVVGGFDGASKLNSAEFYRPNTNSWTIVPAPMNASQIYLGAVTIDNPRYFKTFHS